MTHRKSFEKYFYDHVAVSEACACADALLVSSWHKDTGPAGAEGGTGLARLLLRLRAAWARRRARRAS